jgi:methyl-accepting chemotaxis protein
VSFPTSAPLVLRPVQGLIGRLRTSARLGLLVAVLLVPGVFATWSYAGVIGGQVAFTASERDGVQVLRPALVLLGDTVAGDPVDLAPVRAAIAAHPGLAPAPVVRAMQGADPRGATDPAVRATFAATVVDLITAVGNGSNLILDPDLDSFYVMDSLVVQLPRSLLAAAQAAAPASDARAAQLVADQAVRAGGLGSAAQAIRDDLATAARSTTRAGLLDRLARLTAAADTGTHLATRLSATLDHPGPADPAALGRAAATASGQATAELDALLSARQQGLARERSTTLAVTLLGLAVAVWLAAAFWWRTRSDVRLTVLGMTAIAEGDLRPRPLPLGRDDLGELGRSVAVTRDTLERQNTELLRAHALREQQMQANFEQQRLAQKQVRERAQSVIDETSTAIVEELGEVTGHIGAAKVAAGTIDERMRAADAVTRAVVAQAQEAATAAAALGESLRQVAGMAELIAGVADQTQMLALNATIEAARAGEAGRGFSVVAGEVKELAMTTARSTGRITSTVESLERDADAMTQVIQRMGERITGLDETTEVLGQMAQEQHSLVDRLATAVQHAVGRVSRMATLTAELERRSYERFPVSLTGVVTAAGARYPLSITDLGEGGLRGDCEQAENRLEVGARVRVAFHLDQTPLTLDCLVARLEEQRRPYQFGLHFVDPSWDAINAIRAFNDAAG